MIKMKGRNHHRSEGVSENELLCLSTVFFSLLIQIWVSWSERGISELIHVSEKKAKAHHENSQIYERRISELKSEWRKKKRIEWNFPPSSLIKHFIFISYSKFLLFFHNFHSLSLSSKVSLDYFTLYTHSNHLHHWDFILKSEDIKW